MIKSTVCIEIGKTCPKTFVNSNSRNIKCPSTAFKCYRSTIHSKWRKKYQMHIDQNTIGFLEIWCQNFVKFNPSHFENNFWNIVQKGFFSHFKWYSWSVTFESGRWKLYVANVGINRCFGARFANFNPNGWFYRYETRVHFCYKMKRCAKKMDLQENKGNLKKLPVKAQSKNIASGALCEVRRNWYFQLNLHPLKYSSAKFQFSSLIILGVIVIIQFQKKDFRFKLKFSSNYWDLTGSC